jgi:predicted phage terminase large subunit-like protein
MENINNTNKELLDNEAFESIANDRAVRQAVARASHLMFFHIHFPRYVKYGIAEFQKDIFRITEDESNKLACIIAFRGSAKSTLVTLSYSLWATLGVQQKKFVLIICQTQAQAKQHMMNLRHELENNIILKSDLGPFKPDVGEWANSAIVFDNTGARIMIASIEQSIRGIRHCETRPDLIICDDIEDYNSTKTLESRNKLFDWFTHEVIPLGDIGTRIILVGNLLHEDSLMMRLKKKMVNKEIKGIYREFPLINEDGECLWSSKFNTKEKIEDLRRSIANEASWQQEYLLRIISTPDRVVYPEWIKYYDNMPDKTEANEYRGVYIGIDLAISEKDYSDYTAMVVGHVFGWGDKMRIYIASHPIKERLDFPSAIEKAKLLSSTLAYKGYKAKLYIENNQYQEAFAQMMRKEGYPAEGIHSQGDKRTRLTLVNPLIKTGRVKFPITSAENLVQELTGFGIERHDDLADAFGLMVGEVVKNNHNRPGQIITGGRSNRGPDHFGGINVKFTRDMRF